MEADQLEPSAIRIAQLSPDQVAERRKPLSGQENYAAGALNIVVEEAPGALGAAGIGISLPVPPAAADQQAGIVNVPASRHW